ncbi:hypothetical protein CDL15_Pgr000068 [Punica granatum]|uniref:Uncharacterized protein n=1 Tax=Punica granatum TaxID=22663 RepID=A0A218VQG4_PUNGR|nr:hypothetical protein CDL15_Pgr000068 [Punica granatum]
MAATPYPFTKPSSTVVIPPLAAFDPNPSTSMIYRMMHPAMRESVEYIQNRW